MTEEQLIYFTTIVSCGSYSEAALELDISQSSVSRQILSLEQELGITLFNRKRRQISLTAAGQKLYPKAQHILEQIEELKKDAFSLRPDFKRNLPLLILPIIGHLNFYVLLNRFELENPQFTIALSELEEPALFHRINNGDFQMAFSYFDPFYMRSDNDFIPVMEDEIVLAVHSDSHLLGRDSISPKDLSDMPLMLMEKYTCIYHYCDQLFKSNKISPNVMGFGRPESLLGAVDAGRCCALVPRVHSNFYLSNHIKLLSFDKPLKIPLGLMINPSYADRKGVKLFVKMITEIS